MRRELERQTQKAAEREFERCRSTSAGRGLRVAGLDMQVLCIHRDADANHLREAKRRARPNSMKVILATNVAESSVTFADVGLVLDFALSKVRQLPVLVPFSLRRRGFFWKFAEWRLFCSLPALQEKHIHFSTKTHRLKLRWASRAALEQRRGRTGKLESEEVLTRREPE